MRRARATLAATLLAVLVPVAGCSAGQGGGTADAAGPARATGTTTGAAGSPSAAASPSAPEPSAPAGPLLTADVLVTARDTIPAALRRRLARLHGVAAVLPMSVASVPVEGRTLTVAAADPARFRRFTPVQSARAGEVWARVAGGEVAVDTAVPRNLQRPHGYLTLGSGPEAPRLHIGAFAPLVEQVSAVVSPGRGAELGMPPDNALLVSTGRFTPSVVTGRMRRILGGRATVQTLALEFDLDAPRTAVLSGGSVAAAVVSFRYTPHPDGRVTPDPAWVQRYIRTETVPLLGRVTCNKVMLPQLRAALREVVSRGLSDRIHPGQYGGCYYPRYIDHDPAKGLSLHSWGIAIDLNVPENQRGTPGRMDRQVVAIFAKWGFAWGGTWRYTDPMHFELAALVHPG